MIEADRGYLAALIDRGYIGITRGRTGYNPKILIECDKEIIGWLIQDLEIGRAVGIKWSASVNEVSIILDEVEPYLKVKTPHLKLLRRYLKECRGIQGKKLAAEEIELREYLYLESKKLNAISKGIGTESKEIRVQNNRSPKRRQSIKKVSKSNTNR